MEGLSAITPQGSQSILSYSYNAKLEINATILSSTTETPTGEDRVSLNFNELYKSLTGTAKSIIDKLNELLKAKVPNGIQSLSPEEVTPEATADRLVKQFSNLFEIYKKNNPELDEEKFNEFFEKVRQGVQAGYDDAFETLKALGAFEFEGVQAGVEKTKVLIESKLKEFEKAKRAEFGFDSSDPAEGAQNAVTYGLLTQAGGNLLSVA